MKKWLCIVVCLFHLTIFSQNKISMSVNATKIDFFHGVEYGRIFRSFEIYGGFEYGIVKTIFQSRFFPKVKVGASYFAVNKQRFQLGPVIQYGFSHLKFSEQPKATVNYHELNGGLRWRYGKKWQVGQTLLVGGLWGREFNTLYQKKMTSGTFGYALQIDCVYAF